MFRDMTFCQERKCSFFPSCERAWTRELEEEARKYENLRSGSFPVDLCVLIKGLKSLIRFMR